MQTHSNIREYRSLCLQIDETIMTIGEERRKRKTIQEKEEKEERRKKKEEKKRSQIERELNQVLIVLNPL